MIATLVAGSICFAGTACQAPATKSTSPAPTNSVTAPITSVTTVTATVTATATASSSAIPVEPVPSGPVEVSGSGEAVKTVNLAEGGYTVEYTTERCLIVKPVIRDGSQGSAIINACSGSGVTTYSSTGPVTLQITNARGPWTLRFVPLA